MCNGMGYAPLEEKFEVSAAFIWLSHRAREFVFRLSYPRGSKIGVAFEPWYWFYSGKAQPVVGGD
ncbi:D-alanyl-D-alanine carboxypeptidase family protein [Thiorhodococcus drewsii]|uniref:D-alanyl-D-alanine carboxypeptidase family protein n=1 Tax=Thiorhodococcus drewsii TaxID=210408 RepID=UPI0009FCB6DD